MSDTEIKIKSSELNSLLLKFLTLITGALVGVLIWIGQGLYSTQKETAESQRQTAAATLVMSVRIDSMQKKLDSTMDRREFDLEVSGLKVRMGGIEVKQTALDLEIQRIKKATNL